MEWLRSRLVNLSLGMRGIFLDPYAPFFRRSCDTARAIVSLRRHYNGFRESSRREDRFLARVRARIN